MSNPLVEIAKLVQIQMEQKAKVAVVFDLDSTLFCVSPRTQAILRQLGSQPEFRESHGLVASRVLRDIEVLPTDWGIRTVMERSSLSASFELIREVRDYWRKHFFASHFLDRDLIYPFANEYVRHLHELGADIYYLTGRSVGSMEEGTRRILKHWGFPVYAEDDMRLFMKPSDVQSDEGFKANVLKNLLPQYRDVWFFENEPVIIAQVRVQVPEVKLVFVQSVHSGQGQPPTDLPTIGMTYENWRT